MTTLEKIINLNFWHILAGLTAGMPYKTGKPINTYSSNEMLSQKPRFYYLLDSYPVKRWPIAQANFSMTPSSFSESESAG